MGAKIPSMFRGNCDCGRWLMIPLTVPTFTKDDQLSCECGRKYHVEIENKRIVCSPGLVMPALCLDLDGTIRYSASGEFINHPDDVRVFTDVEDLLWKYRNDGWLIFGISNQGGVAFGYKTELSNDAEIQATVDAFAKNPFHIIKASFHHPDGTVEPYNCRSLLRKPDIGMLALCEIEAFSTGYIVDWDQSIFIGDRPEDEECAKRADIKFIHANDFFVREELV